MCYQLFMRTVNLYDLGKDIENYNKVVNYLNNFWNIDRAEIEDFIIEVRADNPIYTVIKQLVRASINTVVNGVSLRLLSQLNTYELYNELYGELYNIILKGAFDSVKLLNELTSDQDDELAERFVKGDMTIFTQYKCK